MEPDPDLVLKRLADEYGFPSHACPRDVFFCSVYLVLSAQTTLEQALAALTELRRRWPTATALARAPHKSVRCVIAPCGFGATRTKKIIALARAVAGRERSLRALHRLDDAAVEAELVSLPGVGFKSARVIAAMSSLERERFAVDTHVWRIAQRLGWIPRPRSNRHPTIRQADALEAAIPTPARRQLHACLVALGRASCRPVEPRCARCVLADLCPTAAKRVSDDR